MKTMPRMTAYIVALMVVLLPSAAWAQDAALNSGNTAWILTATALVLFMTMPGLALFYGGLVRVQCVISVLMHCFAICCLASILWLICGYSLAFSDGMAANAVIGGLSQAFLVGVGTDSLSGDIPETVFFMFQMTFAVITPALIVGAYVERIKFSAVMLFSGLWLLLVYIPVAHWVWGGGWLADLGVQDFAGGLVVHATCGVAAMVAAIVLGPRKGFPREVHPPHSAVLVMVGAAMLWVGWYGFNAGSALAANGDAGMAMVVTHISAATAAFVWMLIEWVKHNKPTLVGIATGAIAGLATITPASGFVGPVGALIIGVVAGFLCYNGVGFVKMRLGIDDSLDVLAVHGFGGVTGTLLTAILGATAFGGMGHSEVSMGEQFVKQLIGVVATVAWTAIVSYILLKIISAALGGLRVDRDHETEGLDIATHGEKGYEL